jgi:hypothetical protein
LTLSKEKAWKGYFRPLEGFKKFISPFFQGTKTAFKKGLPVNNSLLDVIKNFLANTRVVKFAYLFGSHARGNAGPLSDVDLAVYLDNRMNLFSARLSLLTQKPSRNGRVQEHPCP